MDHFSPFTISTETRRVKENCRQHVLCLRASSNTTPLNTHTQKKLWHVATFNNSLLQKKPTMQRRSSQLFFLSPPLIFSVRKAEAAHTVAQQGLQSGEAITLGRRRLQTAAASLKRVDGPQARSPARLSLLPSLFWESRVQSNKVKSELDFFWLPLPRSSLI